MDFSLEKLIT